MRLPSFSGAAACTAVLAAGVSAQQCSSLASDLSTVLPNATVWFSEFVTGGTNISFPDNDPR